MRKQVNELVKDGLWFLVGSVLYALSVSMFSTPNDIAPGGAAGLAVIMNALWGLRVGAGVILLNIPLMIAAFFYLPRRFVRRTAAVIVLSSVVMDVTSPLLVPFTENRLLAALFGGVLAGLGVGMIMMKDAGTGGSEVAAKLLQRRRRHLSVGRLIMTVDAAVVALSAVIFGELSAALYAAVQVFVCAVMIDHVLYGREEGRLLLIVTAHPQHIIDAVTRQLCRGVTRLEAVGGYTGKQTAMLLCAIDRAQVPSLKSLIYREDPAAFVMVVVTEQVLGEGFLPTRFEEFGG